MPNSHYCRPDFEQYSLTMNLAALKRASAGLLPEQRRELASFLAELPTDALSEDPTVYGQTWIVADRDHLAGAPRVSGTRIPVALILESLAAGMSLEEIVDAYPSLSFGSVKGVLAQLGRELQPIVA